MMLQPTATCARPGGVALRLNRGAAAPSSLARMPRVAAWAWPRSSSRALWTAAHTVAAAASWPCCDGSHGLGLIVTREQNKCSLGAAERFLFSAFISPLPAEHSATCWVGHVRARSRRRDVRATILGTRRIQHGAVHWRRSRVRRAIPKHVKMAGVVHESRACCVNIKNLNKYSASNGPSSSRCVTWTALRVLRTMSVACLGGDME
jgi:hypothetical protein